MHDQKENNDNHKINLFEDSIYTYLSVKTDKTDSETK